MNRFFRIHGLGLAVVASVATAQRVWTTLEVGGGQPAAGIRDIATTGEHIYAVGDGGMFLRAKARGDELVRVKSPTDARLQRVWARSPTEVYALGMDDEVLFYDGKRLQQLGGKFPVVKRKYHPGVEPKPTRIRVQHLWASSPKDVWVTAWPVVLFHFDGKQWKEVDIGAKQVIVRSNTRLTRAVATPRVGPIWGTGPNDVWVRREIVVKLAKPVDPDRFRRTWMRMEHDVMHFDGKRWRSTKIRLPLVKQPHEDSRPRLPRVEAHAGGEIWTQFDDALHRFDKKGWQRVAKLPKANRRWLEWTGRGAGTALILSKTDGLQRYDKGEWQKVPLASEEYGFAIPRLTASGAIVVRGLRYETLAIRR